MPIYEYRCPQCTYVLEVMQAVGDVPPICPVYHCTGKRPVMVKLPTYAAFRITPAASAGVSG